MKADARRGEEERSSAQSFLLHRELEESADDHEEMGLLRPGEESIASARSSASGPNRLLLQRKELGGEDEAGAGIPRRHRRQHSVVDKEKVVGANEEMLDESYNDD